MIQNGYLSDEFNLERMKRAEEQEILQTIREGDKALELRLIQSETARVIQVADRYVSSGMDFEMLFTAGRDALFEAIYDFDLRSGERFTTYLLRQLEKAMQNCYHFVPNFLPIDSQIVQLHDRYELALLELYPDSEDRQDARVQDDEYVANYLGVTKKELRAMKREYSMSEIVSLNQTVYLDEPMLDEDDRYVDLIERIVDPKTDNQAAEYLDRLMGVLSDDERYLVCARDGVLSVPACTDEQIASALGIEQTQVETLYQAAIDKIRKAGAHKP